ncbi:hypothetical protein O6H91_07G097700 [Diphasiastrum complanatum]|uniref:Uncharacterized protein n=1 Tax=Diphasiastrum complanatum TaxID=34168 RepID=A0ACC2D7X3_DIPCM|nr:hypothetical protein O6H91_07G097700 [Diphasiastrum complanatum]
MLHFLLVAFILLCSSITLCTSCNFMTSINMTYVPTGRNSGLQTVCLAKM